MKQLGILGMGAMGQSIATGLLQANIIRPEDMILYDRNQEKLDRFPDLTHAQSMEEVYLNSKTLLIAIKPQSITSLQELAHHSHKPLILSIVAGVTLDSLSSLLKNNHIVRTMPSLTAQIHQSYTPLAKTDAVTDEEYDFACKLFTCIGSVYPTTEETLDYMIAVTGSFPAYLAYFFSSFQKAANSYYIPDDVATDALLKTTLATVELLTTQGIQPDELIKRVCSPGGITQEGIATFKEHHQENIIQAVFDATVKKSQVLSHITKENIHKK